ncbi:NAD-dependent epimerase/dehydratase family protein [Pseudotabrizicola algicola]|uniref:NAD(P)-dependent oxidoreductase n=1 Tax=Pseudotabrizicola algicola TaxID=2709381 RepID=A0A6B3RMK7_9RHOB|nr:NAD(P)-dependent oxidoreductase [Pseudotabrizicola algicola]NEX46413.1 NAD(P)-dependent oxidoreductase [Pseudotabrizicola algicola]
MKGLRVLVTGAAGFVGRHVVHHLLQAGAEPIGLVRTMSPGQEGQPFACVSADLVNDPLDDLLHNLQPDAIIHCAGRTFAADTDEGRAQLDADNLAATTRLISAAARMPESLRLVIVSSAAIWAPMPDDLSAIDETHPMRPVAAYGVSKAAATLHALAEADRLGLDLAVGVPFNVIGPGQPQRLVPQVFIDTLRSRSGPLGVASGVVRDWVDVRDVAAALVGLARPNGPRGLFNIASGKGVDLHAMLEAVCRIGNWKADVDVAAQPASSGVSRSIGDCRRLHAATGWAPRICLDDSLRDMILPALR